MSGELHVRVQAMLYEADARTGFTVVGNIFPTTGRGKALREVLLPVGAGVAPAVFAVTPGRWLVEASLPSGDLLCEEVDVTEGSRVLVDLDAMDSPHETHSWQYIVGNVEPGRIYHDPSTIPVPNSSGSRSFERLHPAADRGADLGPAPAQVTVSWISDGAVSAPGIAALNALAEVEATSVPERLATSLPTVAGRLDHVAPATTDGTSHLFRFGPGGPTSGLAPGERQYLGVAAGGDAYLVTLPCPWHGLDGGESVVEVLVNGRQSPTGSAVAVTVRDPVLGAGLAYLASGALARAAAVFRDVQAMLYGKVTNRLSAAAAGYVLVGTDLAEEPQEWDRWLDNLREWFPQLSDGSILWGVRRLRLARTDEDVEAARQSLVEGFDRGLPAFTLGLSWLIESLSEFPEDPECAARLEQVRRLSWRVDMREPFVVVRLGPSAP